METEVARGHEAVVWVDEAEVRAHGVEVEARAHEAEVLVARARPVAREEVPPSPQVSHRS